MRCLFLSGIEFSNTKPAFAFVSAALLLHVFWLTQIAVIERGIKFYSLLESHIETILHFMAIAVTFVGKL